MRTLLTVVTALAVLSGNARASVSPEEIPWPLDAALVPVGFDSNDKVQLMVEGTFPSTCYKVGKHSTDINHATRTIKITQEAYEYGGVCLRIIIPFAQVIDVGLTRAGEYSIVDGVTGMALGRLGVHEATTEAPDDFLYAPVSDAFVRFDEALGTNALTVKGTFQDRCTSLKKLVMYKNDRVIVVQPIAERAGGGEGTCAAEPLRYLKNLPLPKEWQGNFMLHVRVMNGQAINKIVELRDEP